MGKVPDDLLGLSFSQSSNVMSCTIVEVHRRFGETYSLRHYG
jgi:hypothetical protein